ncbi:hypothetical protein M413DRAFT_108311 [Hebeloma cylindrosporum]|uniref:Cytochrome b mRNA-processing protein 4 n=1 Tax=Hebeloma cylindrosporum TaxID=76867 RepID=A0A0C3CL69_HEBCY|nr:hypothetical protein M413DRAFT_108311 [Hebeloma cylindrosporum h7]
MSSFPWVRFTVFSSALMGLGYVLMKATTPTEEQLYNEMAPDLQRKVDKARAARLAREAAMKRQGDAQNIDTRYSCRWGGGSTEY